MISVEIDRPFAFVCKDGGKRIGVKVSSETEQEILSASYCVILWDGASKYWFLAIEGMSIGYGACSQFGYNLETVIGIVESGAKMPLGLSIYSIMEKGPLTESFALSYMPEKRQRITMGQRVIAYRKYGGKCAYCGKPIAFSDMQVDHLVSHYRNQGKDMTDNYMPSCADCNGLKSDYSLEEFREIIRKCATAKKGTRGHRIALRYGLVANPRRRIVFHFEKADRK